MSPRIIRRHDQFFKLLLDQPGAAGTLLKERLPAEVADRLGPDAPELVNTSFVDGELREYRTDRLYRVRIRDGRHAFIFVLVEHKSSPDPDVGLQLLVYMVRIWEWWLRHAGAGADDGRRRLPLIMPLVVYHGRSEWQVPLSFADALDFDDEALRPHVLDFRYSLADLGRIDDAVLSRQKALRIGLLILKHGDGNGDLRTKLLTLGRAAAALSVDDLITLVRYIVAEPNEIPPGLLREVLGEILPGQEERVMSIASEQWMAEGIQIGRVQGKAEGRAEGRAEGKAEGRAEGKAEILLRQLRRRFGTLPEITVQHVLKATDDDLNLWADRIFDASNLEAIFAPRRTN